MTDHFEESEETNAMKIRAVIMRSYTEAEFIVESAMKPLIVPSGIQTVNETTDDERQLGSSYFITSPTKIGLITIFNIMPLYLNAQSLTLKKIMIGNTMISFQNLKRKKALFRYMQNRKILPPPINIDYVTVSPDEMTKSLDFIAKGLER